MFDLTLGFTIFLIGFIIFIVIVLGMRARAWQLMVDLWSDLWWRWDEKRRSRIDWDKLRPARFFFTMFTYFGGFAIMGFGIVDLMENFVMIGLLEISLGLLIFISGIIGITRLSDILRKMRSRA